MPSGANRASAASLRRYTAISPFVATESCYIRGNHFKKSRPRRTPVPPDKLSSYIAIDRDGTVIAYYGKIDGGQGLVRLRRLPFTPERVHAALSRA
jgi:hypothetical protein